MYFFKDLRIFHEQCINDTSKFVNSLLKISNVCKIIRSTFCKNNNNNSMVCINKVSIQYLMMKVGV